MPKKNRQFAKTSPSTLSLSNTDREERRRLAKTIYDMIEGWERGDWGKRSNSNLSRCLRWVAKQVDKLP